MASDSTTCLICFDIKEKWQGGCIHDFCKDCMRTHMELAVTSADFTHDGLIRHPCGECNGGLSENAIEGLVGTDMLNKYKRFVYDRKVTKDPSLYWCPRPDCVNVVKREGTQRRLRCDKCTIRFCAMCGSAHSRMIACELADVRFQVWRRFATAPGESVKRCPNCRYFIEKFEGCHHMTCRQCNHQFCWVCRSDWQNHGSRGVLCAFQGLHSELRRIHAQAWEKAVPRNSVRIPIRVVSELIITPIGVGVLCTGIGLAIAGVGVGVAGAATFAVVAPPVYGTMLCVTYVKQRARRRRSEQAGTICGEFTELILQHGVTVFLNFTTDDDQWTAVLKMFEHGDTSNGMYNVITKINFFDTLVRFVPRDFTGELFWYNQVSPTVDIMSGNPHVNSAGLHIVRLTERLDDSGMSKFQLTEAILGVAATYSEFPFDVEIDRLAFESFRVKQELVDHIDSRTSLREGAESWSTVEEIKADSPLPQPYSSNVWEACAEVLTIENAANGIWEEPISGVQADNDTQPLDGVSATAGEVCTRFVAEEVLEEDAAKPFYGAPLVDRESTLTPATVVLKDNAMQPADTVTNMLAEVSLNEVDLAEPN